MSAIDYWDSLAEAEQVGVKAPASVVVRRTSTHFECSVDGTVITANTEADCWRKLRESRGDMCCGSCGGVHRFGDCGISYPLHVGNKSRPRRDGK